MSKIFLEIFNLSVAACWLIAAVLIVRAIFAKRMPKWINCCLWALVAIRLVLPFSFESKISLVPDQRLDITAPITEAVGEESIADNILSDESIADNTVSQDAFSENQLSSVPMPDNSADVESPQGGGTVSTPATDDPENIITDNENTIGESIVGGADQPANVTVTVKDTALSIGGNTLNILGIIWISGAAIMMVYTLVSYILLKKRVAMSVPCRDNVRKGEGVDSPFVFGIFRPRIYIPFGLSPETEKCVVAHERAHLKRGDHIVKPLAFLILSVHWFNPLVWVAYILLCRDIEYACDEKVINALAPESRKAYALALLECAVSHKRINACPIAFGEVGVKERVKNTMSYKKPKFWIIICGILVCATVAVLFLTTSAETNDDVSDISNESSEISVEESNVSDENSADNESSTNENSETEENSEISQKPDFEYVPESYIDDIFAAEVIDESTIASLGNIERYENGKEYNVITVLFVPKTEIYDVKIFSMNPSVDWAGTEEFEIDKVLYTQSELTSEKPLVADIELADLLPVNGVSFTDSKGDTRYYAITESNFDDGINVYEVELEGNSEPEVHTHDYGDWTTVSSATCQQSGIRERICDCGEKEREDVEKLSHSYSSSVVAATCKVQGYTLHKCACGDEYKDNYTAKSNLHNFPDKANSTAGYNCSDCGLLVCAWGNYDGSMRSVNRPVKYYITGSRNTTEERTLVIYGTGAIPDKWENSTYWSTQSTVLNDEIKHIVISEGITSIGANCFYNQGYDEYGLVKSISIPSTVTHIGDNAFYGVTFKGEFRMGKNVRTAGDRFMPQKCTVLYIPKTLQSINHDFSGWIYYEGTAEEFAKINFYDYYHGSCKYIDLYEKWGTRDRIIYNAW